MSGIGKYMKIKIEEDGKQEVVGQYYQGELKDDQMDGYGYLVNIVGMYDDYAYIGQFK